MHDPPYRVKNMMPGMIMLWYGSVATIPSGWALCDGTNNTPDLNGIWVRGAGVGYAPGLTGGQHNHRHNFTGDGHSHDMASGPYIDNVYPGGDYAHGTQSTPASGQTDLTSVLPPYHVLCYIMKLPIP